MGLPSKKQIRARLRVSLVTAITKVFLSGFGWQALGFVANAFCGKDPNNIAYWTMVGIGDAMGVALGVCFYTLGEYLTKGRTLRYFYRQLLKCCSCCWRRGAPNHRLEEEEEEVEVEAAVVRYKVTFEGMEAALKLDVKGMVVLALACYGSGFMWQIVESSCAQRDVEFTAMMCITGLVCSVAFLMGMTLARHAITGTPAFVQDLTLAITIFGAEACFTATDATYPGNWMKGFLAMRYPYEKGDPAFRYFRDCSLAGASTALGFIVFQLPLCLLCPPGKLWTGDKLAAGRMTRTRSYAVRSSMSSQSLLSSYQTASSDNLLSAHQSASTQNLIGLDQS